MQTINNLIDTLEEDNYPPNVNGVALREIDYTELRRLVGEYEDKLTAIREALDA